MFDNEAEFEESLIKVLMANGWTEVIKYPTEKDLIDNWARILFNNNIGIDRLNNCPLTDGEMSQILENINKLRTPLNLNTFINGKNISIKRDNKDDKAHYGKEVSLTIYDRNEIAGGRSTYQIAQQPRFVAKSKELYDRRGDLMLLINGMPVIHIELKNGKAPLSDACWQIKKYTHEHIFTGLFSLIQVFVAMTPEESVYFANPGSEENFNENYFFHWADANNERVDNWQDVAKDLLAIPMAHQLIGFYTVPDSLDGVLKVMRSYQYYAANKISDKVSKIDWNDKNLLGGYIWHTTGSGKTMTSFKSAQLIASSNDADKVVFLMDRVELGTQSLTEYRGFASEDMEVQATDSTFELKVRLKSANPADTLIVTSIQKLSNIKEDALTERDMNVINKKRIVFIVDECHRSTFGEMLMTIKDTFPRAIFFGFTGTPILEEHKKKGSTLTDVFGEELHRYSIADGIRDKNVLGFDTYKILTFKDSELREAVALNQAKAKTYDEIKNDKNKSRIYNKFMYELKMYGEEDNNLNYHTGIEDYIPVEQYRTKKHKMKVIEDIIENWRITSHDGLFSAILATSSIPEAIEYYTLFKKLKNENKHNLKITSLFDPHIENEEKYKIKEDGLVEIISDYNEMYNQNYVLPTFDKMKKDIALRFAHKKMYKSIKENEQIDLLIVVNQMLTGFDSKWINTLYLDKKMEYEEIIQAFSRTNRLFGIEKQFGIIKYYRYPHTMEQNIKKAVKTYSGDKPFGIFVDKLRGNIKRLNATFDVIKEIFESAGIKDFCKLPDSKEEINKFAKEFKNFNEILEGAKIQGFRWKKQNYECDGEIVAIKMQYIEYETLKTRYSEIEILPNEANEKKDNSAYNIDGYITSIATDKIDSDYMNNKFTKYLKALKQDNISKEELDKKLDELHKSFAMLSQEEQKCAQLFLHDIQNGDIEVESGKSFKDYILQYIKKKSDDEIEKLSNAFGLNEELLREMMTIKIREHNINEFGRFDSLMSTVDFEKAKNYILNATGKELDIFILNYEVAELIRKFILNNGFEIDNYLKNI